MYGRECENKNGCPDIHLRRRYGYVDSHSHLDACLLENGFRWSQFSFPENFLGTVSNFAFPKHHHSLHNILEIENVFGTVSVHPKFSYLWDVSRESFLNSSVYCEKVLAVGETGLDRKYLSVAPFEKQMEVFQFHIRLAIRSGKPLVIHCRGYNSECLSECKKILPPSHPVHVHCFTGTVEQAHQWADYFHNAMFGITNMVNKTGAVKIHSLAAQFPLDRLLLETDAPHFVPSGMFQYYPYANPGLALNVAQRISQLSNTSLKEVLRQTTANCCKLYRHQF